jgi:hypothetical protein
MGFDICRMEEVARITSKGLVAVISIPAITEWLSSF